MPLNRSLIPCKMGPPSCFQSNVIIVGVVSTVLREHDIRGIQSLKLKAIKYK